MIKSLQGLRVIGMMFIFFFHLGFMKEGDLSTIYNIFFYDGYFAVTFFFILSGLVTYKSLSKNKNSITLKASIDNTKKRIKRIYPLHIITLVLMLITSIQYGSSIKRIILSIPNVLLLQSFIPLSSIYFGFNGVSWYISTLMFCYFMSIYFYDKVNKIKLNNLLKSIIIIYILQFSVVFIGKDISIHKWLFYINPIFRSIDFLIGMIIYRILIEGSKYKINNINYTLIEIGLIIAFTIIYSLARYVPQALRWGVYYTPIIILIIIVFAKEKGSISRFLGNNLFMKLSTISFEFYMIHQIVINKLMGYFIENKEIGIIIMLSVSIVISIGIKHLFNYIDRKVKIKELVYR